MIATTPAGVAFSNRPWRTGIAGTIWNGEVGIAGGTKVEWQWAPLRSLTSLAFAADWKATGPDTDLGGRGLMRFGRTVVDSVSGSAHASLLNAIQPNLPFSCDLVMQSDFPRIGIGGGSGQMIEGRLTTDPGTCSPKGGGAAMAVPSLLFTAEKSGTVTRIRIAPAQQRRQTLIDATLTDEGALTLRMTADGARMLPFIGMPGGASFSGQL